jgi:hypothetical protein
MYEVGTQLQSGSVVVLFGFGAGDWTKGLIHAKYILCHWDIPSSSPNFILLHVGIQFYWYLCWKDNHFDQALMAHSSGGYLEGRDQDLSLKSAQENSLRDPISKKKGGGGEVA